MAITGTQQDPNMGYTINSGGSPVDSFSDWWSGTLSTSPIPPFNPAPFQEIQVNPIPQMWDPLSPTAWQGGTINVPGIGQMLSPQWYSLTDCPNCQYAPGTHKKPS